MPTLSFTPSTYQAGARKGGRYPGRAARGEGARLSVLCTRAGEVGRSEGHPRRARQDRPDDGTGGEHAVPRAHSLRRARPAERGGAHHRAVTERRALHGGGAEPRDAPRGLAQVARVPAARPEKRQVMAVHSSSACPPAQERRVSRARRSIRRSVWLCLGEPTRRDDEGRGFAMMRTLDAGTAPGYDAAKSSGALDPRAGRRVCCAFGRFRHGEGAHNRGDRRRRAFVLTARRVVGLMWASGGRGVDAPVDMVTLCRPIGVPLRR